LFLGGIHYPTLIALNIYIINIPKGIAKNNKLTTSLTFYYWH
jgi:hypothetical protein